MHKKLPFIFCMIMLISVAVSAQHEKEEDFNTEVNQHEKFYDEDSNDHGFFNQYDYKNHFDAYHFIPASQSLRYNRVDALFLGLGTDFGVQNSNLLEVNGLHFDGFLGYSTGLEEWQFRMGVSKPFGNNFVVGGEILSTSTTDDYWRTDLTENSLTSLFAGYDYHDYYKAEGYSAFTQINFGKSVSVSASYNVTEFSSLMNNTGYSFFGDGNLSRINPSIDQNFDLINQESVGLGLQINNKPHRSGNFHTSLIANADLSGEGISRANDFNYNRYEVTSINSFLLDKSTALKVRLMGGSITGDAPDFKNFALGGIGTMRASGYKFYTGDKMLLSNIELVFGDIWSFEDANLEIDGMYISLFMDSGWAQFSETNSADPLKGFEDFTFQELNHNIGSGVGFDFIRFEVATPLSGSEGNTTFWVRLNTSF